jgi:hypothetical protein
VKKKVTKKRVTKKKTVENGETKEEWIKGNDTTRSC